MLHHYIMRRIVSDFSKLDNAKEKLKVSMSAILDEDTGEYAIDDYVQYISSYIYSDIVDFIDNDYTYQDVKSVFFRSGKYEFRVNKSISDVVKSVVISIDTDKHEYGYFKLSDFDLNVSYSVNAIEDDDLVYIVPEHIPTGDFNNPIITKLYHDYFTDVKSAFAYRDSVSKEFAKAGYDPVGEFKVMPTSRKFISESRWYQVNLSVDKVVARYNKNRNEYRMISDLDYIEEKIKADTYHSLTFDDRYTVDRLLLQRILPFVDKELFDHICDGGDVTDIDPSMMQDVVNTLIICAFSDAKTEDDFYAIRRAMGPHIGRIEDLNDQARRHKNEGFVLVSKSGRIRYYSNVYAINTWYGARDNYYHGKFMENVNPLPCFEKFSPDLFVDDFADEKLVMKYENDYEQNQLDMKAKHAEMRLRNWPNDKFLFCKGHWYVDGLKSDNVVDDAKFFAFHYKYRLDEDQCKTLLNGEVLVVDDYKSMSGEVVTIKMKLREATINKEYVNCEICRPDQKAADRTPILMAIGASEPNNPWAV